MMLFRLPGSLRRAPASSAGATGRSGPRRHRALIGGHRLIGVLTVVALVVVPLGMTARADDRSDAVDQQNQAEQRKAELASSLEGVSAELGQAYLDLQSAETSLTTAQDELTTAEATLAEKEREQQLASDRLDVAEADLATVTEEATASESTASESTVSVADLVVSAYQGDSSVNSWSYVLSSSDTVDDLTQRASTMEIAASIQETVLASAETERAQDANRKARQDATTDRVSTLKDEADVAETDARTARDDAVTKRDEVSNLKTEKETAASNLETQKEGLEEQQTQAAADAEAAAKRIAEIDAANRAAYEDGQTGVSSESIGADSLGDGYIGHPITGALTVTSPFGYRVHPVTGVGTGHQGTDFAAAEGTPQYAAASGVATYWESASCGIGVDINAGYIDGHSYVITLCHLSGRAIADGQYVNRGDTVGFTGSTGYATGPHVHFQVAQDGVYIDPMTLPGF
nr:M23 family metallopeptidase [Actinomyces gerencseriae]